MEGPGRLVHVWAYAHARARVCELLERHFAYLVDMQHTLPTHSEGKTSSMWGWSGDSALPTFAALLVFVADLKRKQLINFGI